MTYVVSIVSAACFLLGVYFRCLLCVLLLSIAAEVSTFCGLYDLRIAAEVSTFRGLYDLRGVYFQWCGLSIRRLHSVPTLRASTSNGS